MATSEMGAKSMQTPGAPEKDAWAHTTAGVQAQTLLMALQNFIIPLVQAPVGQGMTENIMKQTTLGREASEFLVAFQTFVTFIIRGIPNQSVKRCEIEPELKDPVPNVVSLIGIPKGLLIDGVNGDKSRSISLMESSANLKPQSSSSSIRREQRDVNSEEAASPLAKVLAGLRQYVFNTMPIRLLSFKQEESKFKISLLERKGIYNHLAPKLRESFNEAEFASDIACQLDGRTTQTEAEQKVIRTWVSRTARYAILSHTWMRVSPGEVTYMDWMKGEFDSHHSGYRKLLSFCKAAWNDHGLTLGWLDTLCINKESSAELDESIRSMYKWYRDSAICLTYLSGTVTLTDMHKDLWFTRGWTLQELLGPVNIKFYNREWKQLIESSKNDKDDYSIHQQIEQATSITQYELRYIRNVPISRRMQLAATREVTREEDIVYSLMGMFDVSIATAYGEGVEQAFFRLVKEILSADKFVCDIFNWAGELPSPWTRISSLLPSRPADYLHRSPNTQVGRMRPIEPLTLTHLGLRVMILLMPAISTSRPSALRYETAGDYHATVTIAPTGHYKYVEDIPKSYNLLPKSLKTCGQDGWTKDRSSYQLTFGILNFGGSETSIRIPKTCFAVALKCRESAGTITTSGDIRKVATEQPIVFYINKKTTLAGKPTNEKRQFDDYGHQYYEIDKSQLANHGMLIVTLCL